MNRRYRLFSLIQFCASTFVCYIFFSIVERIPRESSLRSWAIEESATINEGHRSSREWPKIIKSIFYRGRSFLPKWKRAFLASCVFGVLIDPLFFYIPIVNKDKKCIGLDKSLKGAVISLRSTMDLFYLVNIVIQIYIEPKVPTIRVMGRSYLHTIVLTKGTILVEDALAMANRIWRISSHILIDILAVLPIPQAVILIFMDSSSLNTRKFLAFLALLQYVPRVLRIYLLCTKFNKTPTRETEIWILFKGAFSFFLYILASHVFGAFWYFLAIQREAACWQNACRNNNGCEPTTFYCNGRTIKDITFLDDLCSINPHNTNATPFCFGMFVEAVQSGVLESTNLPKKFFHCFWWGLRNLSSLGQNLETSNYTWENIFAIFISLSGLLLVLLYLTTNLKICMELVTRTSAKMRIIRQLKMKDLEVQFWLSENDIPKNMKATIMQKVHKQLEQNKDVRVENILYILPLEQKRFIKRHLCWPTMKKVPMLRVMDDHVLKEIFDNLKPVSYTEDKCIIGEGEPLVKMLFITRGILLTYTTNNGARRSSGGSSTTKCLAKGDFYGEELLTWASTFSPLSDLPISTTFVKSLTKVEAFALMANDLKTIASKFWRHFRTDARMQVHLSANLIQTNWRRRYTRRGRWYSLKELEIATRGFSPENVIGGGYDVVFRGILQDGHVVAVKNLLNDGGQAEILFKAEVEAIGKVKHKNLVGLIGYCAEGPQRMLVHEYIDNGNLEQWLHGDVGPVSPLTWDIRMKIAVGTAKGLDYLHEWLEPRVVHRDIKPSNILLDRKWNPKVSGFGVAKLLAPESSYVTTSVVGTMGYICPEYVRTGMLNEWSDVYSFGILLMEIITGRRPSDPSRPDEEIFLVDWFKEMIQSRRGEEVVDPLIEVRPSPRAMKRALLVCLRCTDSDVNKRPKMGQIVHMLEADDFPDCSESPFLS
ncbi:cyclic nucleotide-gated ion channel 1 isoform X3 [Prunus persica]|nr:cyclic nucleotide-gated ion channel 1 isoform X3 [Prunus persica]